MHQKIPHRNVENKKYGKTYSLNTQTKKYKTKRWKKILIKIGKKRHHEIVKG